MKLDLTIRVCVVNDGRRERRAWYVRVGPEGKSEEYLTDRGVTKEFDEAQKWLEFKLAVDSALVAYQTGRYEMPRADCFIA